MGMFSGLAFWIADFVPTAVLFLIAFTFNGIGNGILGGCVTLMMPEEKRGAMSGFFQAACIGGNALSGVLYGIVSEAIPIKLACGLGQVLSLLPLIVLLLDPSLKKKLGSI